MAPCPCPACVGEIFACLCVTGGEVLAAFCVNCGDVFDVPLGSLGSCLTAAPVTGAGMECCYAAPNLPKVPKGSVKFFTAGHGGSAYQARSPPIWIPRDLLLRLPRAIPLDPPSAVRRPTGACRDLPLSPKKLDLP